MCGIAGFVGVGSRRDLERMTNALRHRGPDGHGYHVDADNRVFLGHRRLAIVDLDSGHQPMWNEDGQVGIVYNGEIYNHQELRAELVALGHRFASSHSDTEVLVHGYEQWGDELPLKLNGMFAFAIYDRPRRRLFLARDRFGEKPLYYSHRKNMFAFASELTALAKHDGVDKSIDVRAAQKLFGYGYVPSPNAMLAGSCKLPGGTSMSYDFGSDTVRLKEYWRFSIVPDDSLGDADEKRLVDELEFLIRQAANRRLMSDVPLGVFLSGGIDSSVVLASLAKDLPPERIGTFTIGFNEASFNESAQAAIVAGHIRSCHNLEILDFRTARDLIQVLLERLDEPLGDASLIPTYCLSSFTRRKVTVALSGDGGDELFAGYDPFLALKPAQLYSMLMPNGLHSGLRRLVELLPPSDRNMSLEFKLKRGLMGMSYRKEVRLPAWMAPLDTKDLAALFDEPLRPEELYSEALTLWESSPEKSDVDRSLEFFTRIYLQDNILTKVDRASMMCSLETRAVFLDNDVVDFCARLPSRFKLRGNTRKYLLKRVADRLLPAAIVNRKKKGFGMPLAKWLRTVPASPPFAPIHGLRVNWAEQAFSDHRSHRKDYRFFLWNWLSLQYFASRT